MLNLHNAKLKKDVKILKSYAATFGSVGMSII